MRQPCWACGRKPGAVKRRPAPRPPFFFGWRSSNVPSGGRVRLCPRCAAAHDARVSLWLAAVVFGGGAVLAAALGVALALSG
jgi:hypothetical protein